jgi:hypothetical protein
VVYGFAVEVSQREVQLTIVTWTVFKLCFDYQLHLQEYRSNPTLVQPPSAHQRKVSALTVLQKIGLPRFTVLLLILSSPIHYFTLYVANQRHHHTLSVTSTHISLISHSPNELNVLHGSRGFVSSSSKCRNSSKIALWISIRAMLRPKHSQRP